MKFILGLFVFSSLSYANYGKIEESLYIKNYDKDLVRLIQNNPSLTIDHMSSKGFELYGPKGTKKWLDSIHVSYNEMYLLLDSLKSFGDKYPSYTEITSRLKKLVNKYPNIAKLFSIGKSVEGRELWVVKISDNVSMDEVEPEFKYISSMHGNEITGRELTIELIEDLLKSYGTDKRITELVDNTEIFIMPSMNPDGSEKRQRENANSYDLNRNFPFFDAKISSTINRQPETKAVMNFQKKRQFSLSANFHGGTICVNYPWDSTYDRHPFDSLLQDLSLRYSTHNIPMFNSDEFNNGITNGADWYLVKGGMQDWSYIFYNDLQVTIELSHDKWPSYNEIPKFYKDNKESMLNYLESIHQGAGFKLNSKTSGKVTLKKHIGTNEKKLGVFSFRAGEFYKVLDDGLYTFDIETTNGKIKTFTTRVNGTLTNINNYKFY